MSRGGTRHFRSSSTHAAARRDAGSSRRDRERAIADHRFLRRTRCRIARRRGSSVSATASGRRDRHGRRLRPPGPREILAGHTSRQPRALQHPRLGDELGRRRVRDRVSAVVGRAVRRWASRSSRPGSTSVSTPLSGVLFLFLATVSPLLLDITRQARGYGLAFFAMSVLVVAALEAGRTGRTWAIVAVCAAGVVGTWTLPDLRRRVRRDRGSAHHRSSAAHAAAIALGASLVAIVGVVCTSPRRPPAARRQEYGVDIELSMDRHGADRPDPHPRARVDRRRRPRPRPRLAPARRRGRCRSWRRARSCTSARLHSSLRPGRSPRSSCSGSHTRARCRVFSASCSCRYSCSLATGTASILERIRTRPALVRTVLRTDGAGGSLRLLRRRGSQGRFGCHARRTEKRSR